jgi:hypothetical protein
MAAAACQMRLDRSTLSHLIAVSDGPLRSTDTWYGGQPRWITDGRCRAGIRPEWTTFVEYDPLAFAAVTCTVTRGAAAQYQECQRQSVDLFKVSVNYKFG